MKGLLGTAGITGSTVSDAGGVGRQRGRAETYRGHGYMVDLIPKTRIQMAIEEEHADRGIGRIVQGARSGAGGRICGGRILDSPIEEVDRLRTGVVGAAVL